jgi:N-acyl-L-homoserine lactone synthetase
VVEARTATEGSISTTYATTTVARRGLGEVPAAAVAALAAALAAAVALAAAKIMAVQWKRWIRTGAAWAVQVAGYTPRTGKRRRGIKRANTGNGGGRVAKGSQGHRA